jgi:hypothetical protein
MRRKITMGMRVAYVLGLGLALILTPAIAGEATRPPPPLPVDIAPDSTSPSGKVRIRPRPTVPPTVRPENASPPAATVAKPEKANEKTPTSGAKTADPAPAAQTIDHDTVILDNEQRFQGTVLSNQDDPTQVAINTGNGVLILRRERIKEVVYGLTARMGRVKADDLNALVDLAHWCRNNRRNPEALTLLTKAVALPGCDLPTRGLYAQLVDEVHGAEPALPLYVAYRNAGGTDADILARLGELEKARQLWEEQMRALGLDPGASSESGTPVAAAATASQVEEGYEKYTWVGDNPKFANPVTISQTTLVTPEGPRKVLQVDYAANPDNPGVDKAAVVLRRQINQDLNRKLNILAANRSTKNVRIAIAVKTGSEWTYYESPAQSLPATTSGQEFQQLTFDLGAATFKAAASGWAHSAKINGLDQVRELQILIHNGRSEGSLWLAGISFSSGE